MKFKFTGHDTFPLRHGWLFKSINLIENNVLLSASDVAKAEQAITALGVGKNMVNAIKYWAESTHVIKSVIENRVSVQKITPVGEMILSQKKGFDPYLEDIGTIWLVHFLLNFDEENLTAYRYFFNYSNSIYFEKTKLIDDLYDDAMLLSSKVSVDAVTQLKKATLKKDVDCFLSTYASKPKINAGKKSKAADEDYFASPLTELGLIRDLGRGYFQCEVSDRPSLPVNIFLFALVNFFKHINKDSSVNTVSFEDLLTKPLSPGRIFKLSESGLGRLLDEAVLATDNEVYWVDSLGLKQVSVEQSLIEEPADLLSDYYRRSK